MNSDMTFSSGVPSRRARSSSQTACAPRYPNQPPPPLPARSSSVLSLTHPLLRMLTFLHVSKLSCPVTEASKVAIYCTLDLGPLRYSAWVKERAGHGQPLWYTGAQASLIYMLCIDCMYLPPKLSQ